MIENIYVYSNSTRSSQRKFDQTFIVDNSDTALHVFINDIFAYTSNIDIFKNIKHAQIVLAIDNHALVKNIKTVFDSKIPFEKIYLSTTNYYYIVDNKYFCHNGLQHGFLNPLTDKTKSLTAGMRAVIISHENNINANITLINFSDHRDPIFNSGSWHDWLFEEQLLKNYKHIIV